MAIELASTGMIRPRTGISEKGLLGLGSEAKEQQQERVEGVCGEKEEVW